MNTPFDSVFIVVKGLASGKEIKSIPYEINSTNKKSLLTFLRENNLPIASSCLGEGKCSRCVVNQKLLSCQTTVNSYIKKALNKENQVLITVDYL